MTEPTCPHCDVGVRKHEASWCLDAWVAEKVMGWSDLTWEMEIMWVESHPARSAIHEIADIAIVDGKTITACSEESVRSDLWGTSPAGVSGAPVPRYSTDIAAEGEIGESAPLAIIRATILALAGDNGD